MQKYIYSLFVDCANLRGQSGHVLRLKWARARPKNACAARALCSSSFGCEWGAQCDGFRGSVAVLSPITKSTIGHFSYLYRINGKIDNIENITNKNPDTWGRGD